MRNTATVFQRWETLKFTTLLIILPIFAAVFALVLGVAIGRFTITYTVAGAGALVLVLCLLLKLDELTVVLIVIVHIFIDSYLGFATYQLGLIILILLLLIRFFGQSADRPWIKPRGAWLWISFLLLNLYPVINGSVTSTLSNSIGAYLEIVLGPFLMFWLGNMLAKDASAVRRVFVWLSLLAALLAMHTIIEATTGKFLFEVADAQNYLTQYSSFQIGNTGLSRAGSFFGNPNGNGGFLAICFALPLGLFVESQVFRNKVIYLMEMLLILVALLFTYSTGAWAAVFVGVMVFLFFTGRRRYIILLPVLMAVIIGLALVFVPAQINALLAHANDAGDLSLHLADWQTALRVIEAYPLFGVGLGGQAYLLLSNPYRVPAQTVPLAEPDNSFLQWAAISGIPVLLVFLLLLGLAIWLAWRNWLVVETRFRPLFGVGIVALVALSVDSLSVDAWTTSISAYLGWLIAGLISSALIENGSRQKPGLVGEQTGKIASVQVSVSQTHEAVQGTRYE